VEEADGLERVVVAVDPPVSATGKSDACGIIVAGVKAGVVFVLADATVRGLKPAEWAARVMLAAQGWGAGTVVAESNQGGEMVRDVLERAGMELGGGRLRVKLQHAHLSKRERAQPVSVLYTTGRVRHVRVLKELEDEMCSFGAVGDDVRHARSPDRVDALVWAVDELMRKQPRPKAEMF
jgi:phage terminase large subunit-like protein